MPGDASADRRGARAAAPATHRGGAPETVPRAVEVNAHVGALLRSLHESVLNEAVPQRFLDLLHRINGKSEDGAVDLAEPR